LFQHNLLTRLYSQSPQSPYSTRYGRMRGETESPYTSRLLVLN